jgi:uncharacterized membrane protein
VQEEEVNELGPPRSSVRFNEARKREVHPVAYILGIALGLVFFAGCIYYALRPHDPSAPYVLLCLSGAALGWATGILISPRNETQYENFVSYGKSISAFLSGFVLAKLDRIFEEVVRPNSIEKHADDLLVRMLLFLTTFTIGTLFTFVGRGYGGVRTRPGASKSDLSSPSPGPIDPCNAATTQPSNPFASS